VADDVPVMPHKGELRISTQWILAHGWMIVAGLIALSILNQEIASRPSIRFTDLADTMGGPPGGIASLLLGFEIIRPECHIDETVPIELYLQPVGYTATKINQIGPLRIRAPDEAPLAPTIRVVFEVPRLFPSGPAHVWLAGWRTCGSKESRHSQSTPHYSIEILTKEK
jgi:hypothetical protein